MTDKEPTREQAACKLCEVSNGSGCTTPQPDPNHWICKAWLLRARAVEKEMTEPSKTEQDLIEKLDEILLEAVDDFYAETHPINTIRDGIIARFMDAFPELAKARGYVLLGKYDLLVGKPVTGLPQVGNFPPEEYQPILGAIPPEPWELTGYSGDRYLTVEGRKTILEDVYLARKARLIG